MKTYLLTLTAVLALAAPVYLRAERQPSMHDALEHLKQAKSELEHSEKDKGGHRADAIRLIEQAERQIREGIEYDNKHGGQSRKKKR